jgi:hypothetical protein
MPPPDIDPSMIASVSPTEITSPAATWHAVIGAPFTSVPERLP